MRLGNSLAVALVATMTNHTAAGTTISLGHDAVNNYAWLTGSEPCSPVVVSAYGASSECGVEFDIDIAGGDDEDDVATYRLEHCGEATFQLQEHAGGDGWAFTASCEPAPQGDGRMDCSSSTGKGTVLEEVWRCG
ncbi:uncharacterized protein PV07_02135 [Cladophialophora immunda]|uniref:AA1-like domain-containing protein n=1 Tax=Cladophialophora immunda TaxID=569365 RepID=A0A0D2CWG4_9EURO|nr:uncharacterized protein PV07_02135 [Cladophialophora immunda]KIW35438.1 hypothetical protein PV07_02135 [Cladophialophora immunda]OQV02823.1 hypothetical protein CLAIMM_07954 [Cladophialophora immunda]